MQQKLSQIKLLILDVDGVLSDGKIYYSEQGDEIKSFNIKDGLGIKMLAKIGVATAIITGRSSKIVQRRAQELGIEHVYQNQKNKNKALEDLKQKLAIRNEQIAYMGDDLPDKPLMEKAGLGITVSNGAKFMADSADYVTVLAGGEGCVREVADLIIDAQNGWPQLMQDFE